MSAVAGPCERVRAFPHGYRLEDVGQCASRPSLAGADA
jgi:hypothetical protein